MNRFLHRIKKGSTVSVLMKCVYLPVLALISAPAMAEGQALLIEGATTEGVCVAYGAEETLARDEFTVTCNAAPVDCYQHRGQW
ncbi:MAG: hypothetical protein KTR32_22180, partial [Granulosicoccus sp.]|nr:hypothetical protein [Granulosicoccus sp.]